MDIFGMMNMTNPSSPIYQANELSKQYSNNKRLNEEQEQRNRRIRDGYESLREDEKEE